MCCALLSVKEMLWRTKQDPCPSGADILVREAIHIMNKQIILVGREYISWRKIEQGGGKWERGGNLHVLCDRWGLGARCWV